MSWMIVSLEKYDMRDGGGFYVAEHGCRLFKIKGIFGELDIYRGKEGERGLEILKLALLY